jgi:hypothetical protein
MNLDDMKSGLAKAEHALDFAKFVTDALVVAEWTVAVVAIAMAYYVDVWCMCVAFLSVALVTIRITVAGPAVVRRERDLKIHACALQWEEQHERREAARNRQSEPDRSGFHRRGLVAKAWN